MLRLATIESELKSEKIPEDPLQWGSSSRKTPKLDVPMGFKCDSQKDLSAPGQLGSQGQKLFSVAPSGV